MVEQLNSSAHVQLTVTCAVYSTLTAHL